MNTYNIVTGEETEPLALDIDYASWKTREAQVATTIRHSCSLDTRKYLKGLRSPQLIWHADLILPYLTSVEPPSSANSVLLALNKINRLKIIFVSSKITAIS